MSFKMILDELHKNEDLRAYRPCKSLMLYIKNHRLGSEQGDWSKGQEVLTAEDVDACDWKLAVKVK